MGPGVGLPGRTPWPLAAFHPTIDSPPCRFIPWAPFTVLTRPYTLRYSCTTQVNMGGHQNLDMETCSVVGSEVSSLDGDHADLSEAQDSLAFMDEVVYGSGQADQEGAVPSGGGAPLYQPCTSTPCIENYMENGTYGALRKLISGLGISLDQSLPQVCRVIQQRSTKWAL